MKSERPMLIIDDDAPVEIKHLLEQIDQRIHADPEAIANEAQKYLEGHEGYSLASFSPEDAEQALPDALILEPKSIVAAILTHRLDLHFNYDETTEEAIKNDPTHQSLLKRTTALTHDRVKTGITSSVLREHPNAPPARDAARLSRLALYAMLVRSSKPRRSGLRSTG